MSCYLIGYPVGHSMSPYMHNAAFDELGIDLNYTRVPVNPEDLGDFVENEMRIKSFRGANVTIPHKVSVIKYLDEIDETASNIGAVNTIVKRDEILKGYNTDGYGALRALREDYGELEGSKVVLVGAGGAARAIGYVLISIVRSLKIYNRTLRHAEELVKHLSRLSNSQFKASAHPINELGVKEDLEEEDILINATPIGMSPLQGETPVDIDLLHSDLLVFDIVYNPVKTKLLKGAEECAAKTIPGFKMLVYQGVRSFELWTETSAPVNLMMDVVEEKLGCI